MKEPKNMTVKELIDKVIFCAFHLYTDKNLNIPVDELLSRYEAQEKKIAQLEKRSKSATEILQKMLDTLDDKIFEMEKADERKEE